MNNENQIIKSSPRDVLMHLLGVVALYVSVFNILTLLFQYINVAFPDKLNPYFDAGGPIRWSLASIIVIFPVFLWVSRFLYRDLKANPWKNELRIRKWLLYFTLFATAILIIGDLVALVYNFLEGELTTRFVLKILSILIVAAGVFGYYLYDLRRKPEEYSYKAKFAVWTAIGIVLIIVICGFFLVGSPFKQRLIRFDRQKIADLQRIQMQIVNFWIQKERLPQSLDELKNSISGFAAPLDPETEQPYEYKIKGDLIFELCANFNFDSEEDAVNVLRPISPYGFDENWNHSSGRVCFERNIEPDIYKPKERILGD